MPAELRGPRRFPIRRVRIRGRGPWPPPCRAPPGGVDKGRRHDCAGFLRPPRRGRPRLAIEQPHGVHLLLVDNRLPRACADAGASEDHERGAASRRERDGRPRRPEHRPERLGRANATGYDARQSRVLLAERGDTTLRGARSLFPRAVPVSKPCKGGVVGGRLRQRSTRGDTRKRERTSRARHEVAGRTAARAQDRGEWPEHHAATGNGADRATTRRGDRPHGEISIPPGRGGYPSWRPPARRLANRRRLVLVRRRPIRVPRREGSCRP